LGGELPFAQQASYQQPINFTPRAAEVYPNLARLPPARKESASAQATFCVGELSGVIPQRSPKSGQ